MSLTEKAGAFASSVRTDVMVIRSNSMKITGLSFHPNPLINIGRFTSW
jgi:anthranilate/para-aminobenzoate synthase component II